MRSDMPLKVWESQERDEADVTLVRLVARVSLHMTAQILTVVEIPEEEEGVVKLVKSYNFLIGRF